MSRPIVNVAAIAVELRVLFSDDRPHHRHELLALARRHGGSGKHYRAAIKRLKSDGYYLAPVGDYWAHRTTEPETTSATQQAIGRRSLPELARRIRAERGERIRAELRGDDVSTYDAAIALHESTLASLALCAGRSPSMVVVDTFLSIEQEAAIRHGAA